MKLVEQAMLSFQAGRTEKVYEIDLCEVGPDRFVVNYRYGRRGADLKEGTRTVAPVPEADARRIYTKLVNSKTKAGYAAAEAHATTPEAPAPPPTPAAPPPPAAPAAPASAGPPRTAPSTSLDPRRQGVLNRLERGDGAAPQRQQESLPDRLRHLAFRRGNRSRVVNKDWSLNRAIWRAGELRIASAAQLLVGLVGTKGDMRDYCIAWSLGRVGGASGVDALRRLRTRPAEHVSRMATAALLAVLPDAQKAALKAEIKASKPDNLVTWYLCDEREKVLEAVRTQKLAPPHFQHLRAVFKLAEFRDDGQVYGILAHRFATTKAMFDNKGGGARVLDRSGRRRTWMGNRQLATMLASKNPTVAYGSRTRWYMRKRVWRTLKRMGEIDDPAFTRMAVGVLVAYTDEDAREVNQTSSYNYRERRHVHTHYDKFAGYWAFNHLLFLNSPRYEKHNRVWRTQGGWRPGGRVPRIREEAFPLLWDKNPRALLHLLAESKCEPVHVFAVRALRANAAFAQSLPVPAIAMLLNAPYEATVRYGFELAQTRFRPGAPAAEQIALAFAVANCAVESIRQEGRRWFEAAPQTFLGNAVGLAALVVSQHADVRRFVRRFLELHTTPVATDVVNEAVKLVLALDAESEDRGEDAVTTIRLVFSNSLSGIDAATIKSLLEAELGAARLLGVVLLQALSDAALLAQESTLWDLLTHRNKDLREAVRAPVARLAAANPEFAGRFLQMMIAGILRRLLPDGVPGFLVRVLREDFTAGLKSVPTEIVWRLLRSNEGAAQELGGALLPDHLDAATVEVSLLVELASHEILSVREASWAMFSRVIDRMKAEMGTAVQVLDASWEDSRVFAFKLFDEQFGKEDFDPTVLVSICDSVRPDVQRYGRRLITAHFDEAHGAQYLLQLSEHPASGVQLFATNYLEGYAAGNVEHLQILEPYFVRILCAVNRGRVAKQRTHAFLRSEALKSEAAATIVGRILARQSATDGVEGRAESIVTMAAIRNSWPGVTLPLEIVSPEVRA